MDYRPIPYVGHQFVMARPIAGDWRDYDGSTMNQGREEFRPVMIRGVSQGQRVYCIGSQYGHELADFEVGADIAPPFGRGPLVDVDFNNIPGT